MKCKRGVMWKPSTKHFNLNAVEEIHRMENKLRNGAWKNGKPKPITISYPKRREGLSISFKDRVYQRSINDNVLYPSIQKSFIIDNCACQSGKGPDFARKRLKKHLWNHYANYGTDGYVLQIDVKGYYPNMRHDAVKAKFKRYLPDDVYKAVCDVLDTQYEGDIGYNPGSQMVQIAGISLLDDLDHYCKERLHAKHYIRYMDDILIIHPSLEELQHMLAEIESKLTNIGFEVHEKKTHITPLSHGFAFLGFEYRITSTGKIIMTLNSANIKHERRKIPRMVNKAVKGEMTKDKVDQCVYCWENNASKGNSHKLIRRTRKYYRQMWKERQNGQSREKHDTNRKTGRTGICGSTCRTGESSSGL